jgi:FkbM family methyltransferase
MGVHITKHGSISIGDDPQVEEIILRDGGYMYEDVAACLPFVRGTVIDVGAHVGLWSIPVAQKADTVHAFEPNEATLVHLRKNIKDNAISNIVLHEVIVGNPDRTYYAPGVDNSGCNYFMEGGESTGHTLDNEVSDVVTFIKIDVEGMEPEVLKSAERIIKEDQPYFFIEVNPKCLKRQGKKPSDISEHLQGYSFYRYDKGWRSINSLWPSFYNVLAVPQGKEVPKATPAFLYILMKIPSKLFRLLTHGIV